MSRLLAHQRHRARRMAIGRTTSLCTRLPYHLHPQRQLPRRHLPLADRTAQYHGQTTAGNGLLRTAERRGEHACRLGLTVYRHQGHSSLRRLLGHDTRRSPMELGAAPTLHSVCEGAKREGAGGDPLPRGIPAYRDQGTFMQRRPHTPLPAGQWATHQTQGCSRRSCSSPRWARR